MGNASTIEGEILYSIWPQSYFVESRKTLTLGDLATLLHTILFAYQKSVRDILGSGAAIFVQPVLTTVNLLHEKFNIPIIQGQNIEEVMENYAKLLMSSGLVKSATVEKLPQEGYVFRIEGCTLNPNGEVHELLKPEDVTCPLALVAQAIYSKASGKKIAATDTIYKRDLAVTEIKPLPSS